MTLKPVEKFIKAIQMDYIKNLGRAAVDYLKIGLREFHEKRFSDHQHFQASLGDLCIAIELMLKTYLVSKNLLLIFKEIPDELRTVLICPDCVPDSFSWKKYEHDFRTYAFKTIEFDECISRFYTIAPFHKEKLHPYLRNLAKSRNLSIHSVFPFMQKYDFERAAYVSVLIFNMFVKEKLYPGYITVLTDGDLLFFDQFPEDRVKKVKKAVEEARERAKKLDRPVVDKYTNDWEYFTISCPVCGSDALLGGYSEEGACDGEDGPEPNLFFFADSLFCSGCCLTLQDTDELRLAGTDVEYDRSDELNEWWAQSASY